MPTITKSLCVEILLVLALGGAVLRAAEADGAKPKFLPNPKFDLGDNTAAELGPFVWEKPAGEADSGSVTDYSGMVYDMHNHRILLFGGGHATTFTDAIYCFGFADLKWTSLYKPTPAKFYTKDNMDRGFWKAGEAGNYPRPVGRHTYDLLVVPDDREELLLLRGGCGPSMVAPVFGYWGGACGNYDFKTDKWKMTPVAPFGGYGGVSAYDPVSKKVIGAIADGVWALDVETGQSQKILDNIGKTYKADSYCGTLLYSLADGKMYCVPANKKIWSLDLDRTDLTKSKITVLNPAGLCPPSECAFAYDSRNKVIGGGVLDNKFYVYDPAQNVWSAQEIQGGKPGNMLWHCMVYDPVDNAYVFLAGNKTWAYRWKKDSASGK